MPSSRGKKSGRRTFEKKSRQEVNGSTLRSDVLSRQDIIFLRELKFSKGQSSSTRLRILGNLTMRQLDKLKMMFTRIQAKNEAAFKARVKQGILRNNLDSFAEAIDELLGKGKPHSRRK